MAKQIPISTVRGKRYRKRKNQDEALRSLIGRKREKMIDQKSQTIFTAFFDGSAGISQLGRSYTVIGAVLIRVDLYDGVDSAAGNIWDSYLPGVKRCEFHATDLEESTIRPFSLMADLEPLKMQKDFIRLIDSADLAAVAVTIDDELIKSNALMGHLLEFNNSKVIATGLAIGQAANWLIDVSSGESLALVADEGLFKNKIRDTFGQAINIIKALGGKGDASPIRQTDLASDTALDRFLVKGSMPEIASHKSVGIQLADHVARYVFKNAGDPSDPLPQYSELCAVGLKNLSLDQNPQVASLLPGINIHIRTRKGLPVDPHRVSKASAHLGDLPSAIPKLENLLQNKLGISCTCPRCRANLFWGMPTAQQLEAAHKGEITICKTQIQENNYCPKCRALVFKLSDYLQQLGDLKPQSG